MNFRLFHDMLEIACSEGFLVYFFIIIFCTLSHIQSKWGVLREGRKKVTIAKGHLFLIIGSVTSRISSDDSTQELPCVSSSLGIVWFLHFVVNAILNAPFLLFLTPEQMSTFEQLWKMWLLDCLCCVQPWNLLLSSGGRNEFQVWSLLAWM